MSSLRIAFVNGKGGSGKTRSAVSLATYWAHTMGEVMLVDVDPQETGSATLWLDRTDDSLPGLFWSSTTAVELAAAIDGLEMPVIMDTRPAITSSDVQVVASLADVVVIPGSTDEIDSIVETHRRIESDAPRVALITRTLGSTLEASTGASAIAALEQVGIPVLGSIRWNQPLARGSLEKRRPDQLKGGATARLRKDMEDIVAVLGEHVKLPKVVGATSA